MTARPVRDVFGNAIRPGDWEALPSFWVDRHGVEQLTVHANHPMCRVLGADGQWSIFDVLRMTHASAAMWRTQSRSTFWRSWLVKRAAAAGVPAWRVLADAGCPRIVVEEFAATLKADGAISFNSTGDRKETFQQDEEAV